MVITRRAAAANLANQNHELTNKTHHQSIKPKQKDKRSHSTSSSSTHPTLIGKSKSNRKKTKVVHHHPSSDPTHPSDSIQNPNQDKENKEKKSVFGFKFDSSSIPVSNFNPTLCYDFSTSFVPSKGNSLNSIQSNSLLNPTSSVHQTHQNLKSTNTSSIKPNLENDEFQTMKSAINTITQFLATSNEDPNHILSIFEGIMADPVMRARVPTRLLQDYEMALTQRPGCSKEMILIDGLVAATGTATRLAKDLMRRKQQIRQSFQESTHHPASYPSVHPSTHPITSALSLNRGDPLTEYNLSQCESSMIPGNPMNPKPLSFQPILNQPILQLDPPIQLRQSTSNLESGFEVQSVTPTVIEANPSTLHPRSSTSNPQPSNSQAQPSNSQAQPSNSQAQPSNSQAQPLSIQASQDPQAHLNPHQTQQISNLQTILNQSTSMNLSSIQDPSSIESQRLRKAKTTLTAIKLQSGEEEAKEVYAGFQLMVVYELIGILSTELWSDVYTKYLNETNDVSEAQRESQGPSEVAPEASGSGGVDQIGGTENPKLG